MDKSFYLRHQPPYDVRGRHDKYRELQTSNSLTLHPIPDSRADFLRDLYSSITETRDPKDDTVKLITEWAHHGRESNPPLLG